jgi:hypothetical protein
MSRNARPQPGGKPTAVAPRPLKIDVGFCHATRALHRTGRESPGSEKRIGIVSPTDGRGPSMTTYTPSTLTFHTVPARPLSSPPIWQGSLHAMRRHPEVG